MARAQIAATEFVVFRMPLTAPPQYADKYVINPSSVMRSGAMRFEVSLDGQEASTWIEDVSRAPFSRTLNLDLGRLMPGATKLRHGRVPLPAISEKGGRGRGAR